VEQTFKRWVLLPCGGEIVIQETEVLTSIDVNTNNYKVGNDEGKNYIFSLNCEAAKEITRQLRLTNIEGLIVIDLTCIRARPRWNGPQQGQKPCSANFPTRTDDAFTEGAFAE
jgi:ribonuclease G